MSGFANASATAAALHLLGDADVADRGVERQQLDQQSENAFGVSALVGTQ